MRTTLSGSLGLALSILGLAGCGTYSVPRFAVKGTTIMFPVPDGFGAGFGRALNDTLVFGDINPGDNPVDFNAPHEDFQRGELLFALREEPSTSSARITYLPVRYVTRVHADESSGAALPEEYDNAGTPVQTGQIVAFVDIPYIGPEQLPAGTYYVFVERWRRSSSGSPHFVQLTPTSINHNGWPTPWVGWAALSPDQGIKLRIVDQSGAGEGEFFHQPAIGFDKWAGSYSSHDHAEDLDRLVPNLKLRIWIGNPQTDTYPAAWEMELAYPVGKFEVIGASLGRNHRSGSLVTMSTTGSPSGPCQGSGTARISMIDPDQHTFWVDLVYKLRSPACGRATVSDFTLVGSPKVYDIDGNPISLPPYIDPVYSF